MKKEIKHIKRIAICNGVSIKEATRLHTILETIPY